MLQAAGRQVEHELCSMTADTLATAELSQTMFCTSNNSIQFRFEMFSFHRSHSCWLILHVLLKPNWPHKILPLWMRMDERVQFSLKCSFSCPVLLPCTWFEHGEQQCECSQFRTQLVLTTLKHLGSAGPSGC